MKERFGGYTQLARSRIAQLARAAGEAFDWADEKGGDLRDELMMSWKRRQAAVGVWRQRISSHPALARAGALWANRRRVAEIRNDDVAAHVGSNGRAQAEAATEVSVLDSLPPLGDARVQAQVFGRLSCPWTQRAVDLLGNRGIDARFVDLTLDENALTKTRLEVETRQHTVPYVFLRGEFIGGYNALAEVERVGQLELRTMTAAEQDAAPAHYKRVQVVDRLSSNEVAPGEVEEPGAVDD